MFPSLLQLAAALLCGGCATCLTVPANDPNPPVATVSIFVDDATGTGVEEYVNTTDHNSPVTMEVPRTRSFTVLYGGRDDGGVKTTTLDWKYYAGNQLVQPLITPDDYSGDSCVVDTRAKAIEYKWQGVRRYEIAASATDFHDNRATTPTISVRHGPTDWPLGDGPFKAGFRVVSDIPIDANVPVISTTVNGVKLETPAQNTAIVYHPATTDGEAAAFAPGGPFPVIVFGHAKRLPAPAAQLCPGAPADTKQDFRQVLGILAQLARWGFVTIAPDLSWLTTDAGSPTSRKLVLKDALAYLKGENSRAGSPFSGKLKTTSFAAMGHSFGGDAAIFLGTSGLISIDALGLIAPSAAGSEISEIAAFAPKPVLILHGTQDTSTFGAQTAPLDIFAAASATKHLVKIDGANHFGYTDGICIPGDGPATITQRNQQRIAIAYLTAFYRRYLGSVTAADDYLTGVKKVQGLEAFDITVTAVP